MKQVIQDLRSIFARGMGALVFARNLPPLARHTLWLHLPAEVLIGLFGGVTMLADLVTRKTLGAPKWMLALQTSVPVMTFLLAMVWRDVLEGRDRRRVILLSGLLGKGLFVAVAAIASPGPFLLVVICFALADSAFIPLRNAIFRANYDSKVRGRLFGGVTSFMNLALVVANLGAAWLLDQWEWTYRILFPVAGVLGFGAHAIYSRIRVQGPAESMRRRPSAPLFTRLVGPVRRGFGATVRILKNDPLFRAYERNFFIYGLAFLMNLPLVVLLIVDELNLEYREAAFSRFIIGQVMMIVLSPFAGRLLDRLHPTRLMAWGCGLLMLHAALLAITHDIWMLTASYMTFGIAMTAVSLGWNLGPVAFAKTEADSADYMAVHVTLTGLRGILGPVIALLAEHLLGLRAAFGIAASLYLLASLLMLRLARKIPPDRDPGPR